MSVASNHLGSDGKPRLSFHINRFDDIINILRYEKPLWVYITSDARHVGIRRWFAEQTFSPGEPVGEKQS